MGAVCSIFVRSVGYGLLNLLRCLLRDLIALELSAVPPVVQNRVTNREATFGVAVSVVFTGELSDSIADQSNDEPRVLHKTNRIPTSASQVPMAISTALGRCLQVLIVEH